jgi:hypothetical protein
MRYVYSLMARTPSQSNDIRSLVETFAQQLIAAVEAQTTERIRASVVSALGAEPKRGPGRPPKNALLIAGIGGFSRKPREKQLCPVPGCKNPAAPVFGMVCADHKDLPKAEIKKYREQRRAEKANGDAQGKSKRGAKKTAKRAVAA